ncbi:acyl carrier protein [Apibacter muscae]|uniref:acyl carrier protein n=1 Tax=Apibacter muscae TaxID=2509004 RepID=UPI0011AD09A1|nr:acyl carrier protein [Apibacter muscae]TWP25137.1 acyl carrier protein [Apibacter muscae]
MEIFIQRFKDQLEDTTLNLDSETDYVNSDFWDSLTAVAIHMMIENEYKVYIEVEQLSRFKTIKGLFDFIQENK